MGRKMGKEKNVLPEQLPGWVKNEKDNIQIPEREGEYIIMWDKHLDVAVFVADYEPHWFLKKERAWLYTKDVDYWLEIPKINIKNNEIKKGVLNADNEL